MIEPTIQTIPKKNIVFLLLGVVTTAVVFLILVLAIERLQIDKEYVSPQSLSIWKVMGLILSVYAVTTPWRWQKKFSVGAVRSGTTTRPIVGMLLIFYGSLASPLLYGLVLYFWGLPLVEYYYFAGVSIAGALAWGVYNLRKLRPGQ
jgi:hypothetical protein